MGSNIQFNSYVPRYYNASNLSVNGNSGTSWPLNHDNNNFSNNGNFYNAMFLSSPDYLVAHNKELLKQTMLKHETIFKDQIQELHRVYRRQRELMNEIRRNDFNSFLKCETSHSSNAFFQAATELVQGNSAQACSEPKFKRVGKKFLDLHLPADEYIDFEEKHLTGHENKASQGLEASRAVYKNDTKSFFGSDLSNSVYNSAIETPHSVVGLSNRFSSSTGQFSLEEYIRNSQKRSHFEASPNHLPYHDETGIHGSKLNSIVEGFNADKCPSVSKSSQKDLDQAFQLPTFQHGNLSLSADRQIHGSDSSRRNSDSLIDNRSGRHSALRGIVLDNSNRRNSEPIIRTPIAVQALPCFTSRPDNGGLKDHTDSKKRHSLDSGYSWLQADPVNSDHVAEKTEAKSKGKRMYLDLNMAFESVPESETELFGFDLNSSAETERKIDSDAPSSPENKECSPPRGESDAQNDSDELAKIAAAEAIVFISSSITTTLADDENSCPLSWFAAIASSSSFSPSLNVESEMDYFEAMTLSLAEAEIDDLNSSKEEKETMSMSLSTPRQKRKRRRKDFQREVLPSMASLSRYEVREDLHRITTNVNVICWGNVKRRRRGQRFPLRVTNQLIVTQV